jgi:hypothetical protein
MAVAVGVFCGNYQESLIKYRKKKTEFPMRIFDLKKKK